MTQTGGGRADTLQPGRPGSAAARVLSKWADRLDWVPRTTGRLAAWGLLGALLLEFLLVLLRYVFSAGSIWITELVIYLHACVFMLGAAWGVQAGSHVRVDLFYASARPRAQAWTDLLGAMLLLLPFALALFALSTPYVARSWSIFERSREASGLPLVFLFKSLVLALAGLLTLAGVAQAMRSAAVLLHRLPR